MEELRNCEMSELKNAYIFAADKHANQKRKYSEEPYITHPEFVTCLLSRYTYDSALLKAALLHDVVEDTDATIEDVRDLFGDRVAGLVEELTVNTESKKALGKKQYMSIHFNSISSDALLIKLVDRLHNVISLLNGNIPKDFIEWYWKETVYILDNIDRDLNEEQTQLVNILLFILNYIELYKLI